jgi:hypothetical protein
MTLYKWSQTSASDATADSTINWQEGQAPSTVNDSARAMMAATAKYRDDLSGALVTGGTSTAYTVTSNQAFDTLAHLGGQTIAFTLHATNGATVTLNVDSLGAKPLRSGPSVELAAGALVQGACYTAVYNNSDAVFYLRDYTPTIIAPNQVVTASITDANVTYAKIQSVAASRLLGKWRGKRCGPGRNSAWGRSFVYRRLSSQARVNS